MTATTKDIQLVLQGDELVLHKGLDSLNLSKKSLSTVPDLVFQMVSLTELNLNHNQLTHIPDDIVKLTSLKFLLLSYNQLSQLPDSLGQLTSLVRIDVNNNHLSSLPESMTQLHQLCYFDETGNCFTSLPQNLVDFFYEQCNGTFEDFMSKEQKKAKQLAEEQIIDQVFKDNEAFLIANYDITDTECRTDPTKMVRIYKRLGITIERLVDKKS